MWRSVCALALVAVLAAACSKKTPVPAPGAPQATASAAAPAPATGQEVRLVLHSTTGLDWTGNLDREGQLLAANLYRGLLVMTPDGNHAEPGAAASFEVDPDGTTYTFHLREGERWSDGQPVTAADFLASWKRSLAPGSGSASLASFRLIAGAPDFLEGRASDPASVAIAAPDQRTLTVRLARPFPLFPLAVAGAGFLPIPSHVLAAHPDDWSLPPHAVGNGPWVLAEWKPGQSARLTRNPAWQQEFSAGAPSSVQVSFVPDMDAGDALYRAGRADLVVGMVTMDTVRSLRAEKDPGLLLEPVYCVSYLAANLKRGPLADPNLRHAIHAAIDRERLTLQVLGLGQEPAWGMVPRVFADSQGYPARPAVPLDPQAARAALAKASTKGPVELVYNENAGNRLVAEAVQADLKSTLGLEVRLTGLEWKTFLATVQRGEFDLARYAWCAELPDPAEFVRLFHSEDQNNVGGYADATVDLMLEGLDREIELQARNRLVAEVEARLALEMPAIPLYGTTRVLLVRPCLRGVIPNPLEVLRLDRLDASGCGGPAP
jgi:oligopeptide transport system substrate-binding protein